MSTITTVYFEERVKNHPRTLEILSRLPHVRHMIPIQHYSEVFKPKSQSFRLQKQDPALILAFKSHQFVLPTPEGFGVGGHKNFYFSPMLNCPFDCRYCFLQGMYASANFVIFVNYEDFFEAIERESLASPGAYFFSGYDADSLAFTHISGLAQAMIEAFRSMPHAMLELRTKSLQVGDLLKSTPYHRVITAFSLTPDAISIAYESGTPPISKRIKALKSLAQQGWQVGIRLDPLIDHERFESLYRDLLDQLFCDLPTEMIHSVSVGPLRFPKAMYKNIVNQYPDAELLAQPLVGRQGMRSYSSEREAAMQSMVRNLIAARLPQEKVFSCSVI